ncbi:sensor histidine kinase [Sphingomonas astaxanthinifaciens]|uniref:histidine kinase n=1 Tax=Sphingomonas astaxanthinifaciens DSM 22298 TaxID=1123267 RepID=A0ABQ5Z7F1_9SPHN|nr:sensor histidine kinase KdpD [Sphingomonas astaxanthinifaciens]GLR48730.1 two-component sensor histidine kinase [Sphingomonas astaxanthinifaciens DSM 22298]
MTAADPPRPSPDALLRQARRAERGRLKIYLGASPGVGKTYEMLADAAGLRAAGLDVVVGIVETHGRVETMALTAGFEILPRRTFAHQGRPLEEMDLDALLARHPKLALVDELAHTNAPGSRHPKRYQDVEELLAAGIDVHTTLNIQHIESLNDLVASFTRVRVRETVPDSVIEQAELEVVDLPPDELIQRLKDGKVYVPDEASRALSHFFSRSNLSALRELALRQAAQRVDRDILDDAAAGGLAGKWAAGERVLVAVSELPGADSLVRATKRLADALRAPWVALHVETGRSASFGDAERQRLAATLQLAARLGAEVVSMPAETVLEGIKRHAADARTTQIVVGKSARSRWFELRHGSVVDRLVRETPEIAVHVLPLGEAPRPVSPAPAPGRWGRPSGYLWSALSVAAITGLGYLVGNIGIVSNIGMLFLVPVLFAAMRFGLRTGIATGVLSSLCYNFFFLPPLYTFTIGDPENVVAFLVLLGVAIVVSQLAARAQAQATIARKSAAQNSALAGIARHLTGVTDRAALGDVLAREAAQLLGLDTIFLTRDASGAVRVTAGVPDIPLLDALDRAAAEWAFDRNETTGRGSGTLTASDWQFHAIAVGDRVLALLGLGGTGQSDGLRSDRQQLLVSVLGQASLALRRVVLEEEMADVAKLQERDRLKAALLSSVSHDLRTPLTAILAATDELRRRQPSPEGAIIEREAQRLNRFVANLLEMVRVESGALDLKPTAVDITDAVASAVHDLRSALADHPLELQVPPDLPLVRADERLLHQCLVNLLENAAKFSPAASRIIVAGRRVSGAVQLQVIDEGPGIPAASEERIFETFARLEGSDRVGGTGLGLAIVRGFATGMGLTVSAANRADRTGAIFTIGFPESHLVRETDPC